MGSVELRARLTAVSQSLPGLTLLLVVVLESKITSNLPETT